MIATPIIVENNKNYFRFHKEKPNLSVVNKQALKIFIMI